MDIVAISDLHGHLPEVPPCHLLLLAGDLCPYSPRAAGSHFADWQRQQSPFFWPKPGIPDAVRSPEYQSRWLADVFRPWLATIPAEKIIGIAGNHDFIFQRSPQLVPQLPWTYLQDSGTTWHGLNIWGTPWQPWFWDWAFNAHPAELHARWSLIPQDTDILVVHGPPHTFGDSVRNNPEPNTPVRQVGCPLLLERLRQLPQSKLVVFGHIHSGYGQWSLGSALLANVSRVNEGYQPINPLMCWCIADSMKANWWSE